MIKFLIGFFLLIFILLKTPLCFAESNNSFVSIINPVRGYDFWQEKDQKIETAVLREIEILRKFNLPATWLIRFDALDNKKIIEGLNSNSSNEKGLFLEVTPSWTSQAEVSYHKSDIWHSAASAFLTGYEGLDREKLIDTAFEKFKNTFGYYPVSVGAWWIDSYSLNYMKKKYGVIAALIVSDQYSTDNYQIWGQYFSTPFYPQKNNALHPAQTLENKLDIVIVQWAARDPLNGYGNGVEESTFSIQANDYMDYHNLNTKYFSNLLDIYTKQKFNQFSHLVVGLENSYSWNKYSNEYAKQIAILSEKKTSNQLSVISMKDFALWYQKTFPKLSPKHIIIANDPLGSFKKVVWFMDPYYRAGWFYGSSGSVFRDIRQYIEGEEEICFRKRCDEVNFATSATRVLDEVSFGHKYVLDEGKISSFKVEDQGEKYVISYLNEAGNNRVIEFLPRDISIDGKISSIDGAILDATKLKLEDQNSGRTLENGSFKWTLMSVIFKVAKFLAFIVIGLLVPGYVFINKITGRGSSFYRRSFLSITLGFVLLTLLEYIFAPLGLKQLIFIYFFVNFLILIKNYKDIFTGITFKIKTDFLLLGVILTGTIFQQLPIFRSGLIFPYGMGFWGPNTHDGIWHISLINQLIKSTPPQNPIFEGLILKNYHYFYDLLVASTNYITNIPILDLVFRFYPILFSLLLGVGTYYFTKTTFGKSSSYEKMAIFFSLYLVYFSGSFGWIVEYIKQKHLGGESAFWANQSISFNLNPPFAISLLIIISILQILLDLKRDKSSIFILTILCGSLVAFKSYGGILILITLLLTGIIKRSTAYLAAFFTSSLLSLVLFLSNFTFDQRLITFSPFWFIHSMIDSPDRVGWARLSLARESGIQTGNWFKFIASETVSLVLFIVGNLGMRFFSLVSLININSILKNTHLTFIFIFSLLALFIPILFIQSGNPWNTIQFIYYFLYIASILGGIMFTKIVTTVSKVFAFVLIVIFMCLTPINSWATANGYLGYNPHGLISNKELEALRFLETKEGGVVLTYPYDKNLKHKIAEPWPLFIYDSTAYVSALSKKSVYLEDESQNQILLTDYKKRIVASKDFFSKNTASGNQFLKTNNIKYIYLPKVFKVSLNSDNLAVRSIFENDEVQIYIVGSI